VVFTAPAAIFAFVIASLAIFAVVTALAAIFALVTASVAIFAVETVPSVGVPTLRTSPSDDKVDVIRTC